MSTLAIVYLVIMVVWLCFGVWEGLGPNGSLLVTAPSFLAFFLFAILGYVVFLHGKG